MTVYSVKIIESTEQVVYGIPRSIQIETNVSAVVFYSFTGIADATSNVYLNSIVMPQLAPFTLSLFITNGTDTFSTSYTYRTNAVMEDDRPLNTQNYYGNLYPFTDHQANSENVTGLPFVSSSGGDPVYTPYNTTGIHTGYDADGYPTGFTNKPYNILNYTIKGDYYDKNGFPIIGIGFAPPKSIIEKPAPPPIRSSTSDMFFDPKANVIIQNVAEESPNEPPMINHQYFNLPLANHKPALNDFKKYYRTSMESHNTGSMSRQLYNPTDQTLNYFYHDQRSNRWIISKVPYIAGKLTLTNPYGFISPWKIWRRIPNLTRQNPYW